MSDALFDLPRYEDLSKDEQDPIMDWPLDKPLLVSGPPGTGKTVLALYRCRLLREAKSQFQFIVYNNALNDYLRNAIKALKLDEATAATFHSWLYRVYNRELKALGQKRPPPAITGTTQNGKGSEDSFLYDWAAIQKDFSAAKLTAGHMVLDEGQDLPPDFYAAISGISTAYTIFADENQRIGQHQCKLEDIRTYVGKIDERTLKRNYRNTLPIARLAAAFHVGIETGIATMPQASSGQKPVWLKGPKEAQMARIVQHCRNNATRSIGIFVPDYDLNDEAFGLLNLDPQLKSRAEQFVGRTTGINCSACGKRIQKRKTSRGRDCFRCPDWRWVNGQSNGHGFFWPTGRREERLPDRIPLKFRKNTVCVLNTNLSKGLEFDTVFVPFLQTGGKNSRWDDATRMLLYVVSSRARKELVFLSDGPDPEILSKIPMDLMKVETLK